MTKESLAGRVAVLTGAGAGIGRATARRFAEQGAALHLVDRDAAAVEETARLCLAAGARAQVHVVDCRDAPAMSGMATAVRERDPVIDVLFLNAGVGCVRPVREMTLDDWHFVLDTNLYGVVHGLHAFLESMIGANRGGHILITASMMGLFSMPGAGAYAASKHALIALAEALRAELRPHAIEVTAICPGLVSSEIIRRGRHEVGRFDHGVFERVWERFGAEPDRVARIVVECIEERRGGIQLAAPTGTLLWYLRRYAPSLYSRALSLAARA
jgi:NADP-dependent 3-hydroxy acid dehydrogenase YdfG